MAGIIMAVVAIILAPIIIGSLGRRRPIGNDEAGKRTTRINAHARGYHR